MSIHQLTGIGGAIPPVDPLHRGRPLIQAGTILTDTGRILAGATMDLRKQTSPVSSNQTTWDNYRAAGLNFVRYGVKTDADGAGRPVATQLPYIDAAVDCAWNARMYIMILVSINPGSYNKAQLTEFWTAVAPRYADRPHVIYEMTNEPVSGGGYWGATPQWTTPKLTDLRDIYDIMLAGAPNTPIVLFSTPNISPSATSWRTVPEQFSAIRSPAVDWTKAIVGFHHYPGTYASGDPDGFGCLASLKSLGYNLLMTECNDFIGDPPSNDPRNHTDLWVWLTGGHGGCTPISWVCLDGKGGTITQQITSKIIPALNAAGFGLVVE